MKPIPLKQWIAEEAKRTQRSAGHVRRKWQAGHYADRLTVRVINARVKLVVDDQGAELENALDRVRAMRSAWAEEDWNRAHRHYTRLRAAAEGRPCECFIDGVCFRAYPGGRMERIP